MVTPVLCEQGVIHHLTKQYTIRQELDARHTLRACTIVQDYRKCLSILVKD